MTLLQLDGRVHTHATPSPLRSRRARPPIGAIRERCDFVRRRSLLVVDDRHLAAEALQTALRRHALAVTVARNTDIATATADVAAHRYDVVIVGVPNGKAADRADLITALTDTGATVIALTEGSDRLDDARCFDAGVAGIAHTTQPLASLVDYIGRAAEGLPVAAATDRVQAIVDLREHERSGEARRAPFEALSRRERDVLRMILDGCSAAVIARESFVSVATVRTQIRSILQKLDVNSQVAAIALARSVGWS